MWQTRPTTWICNRLVQRNTMTNDTYEREFHVGSYREIEETAEELREVVKELGEETGYVRVRVETTTKEQVEANQALRDLVRSRDSDSSD